MNLTTSSSSPFGMQMQNRTWEALENGYRFGFNVKERDDEVSGSGNCIAFEARIYDSRLGRWFTRDPLLNYFPDISPYVFGLNNPVYFLDIDGMDIETEKDFNSSNYKRVLIKMQSSSKTFRIMEEQITSATNSKGITVKVEYGNTTGHAEAETFETTEGDISITINRNYIVERKTVKGSARPIGHEATQFQNQNLGWTHYIYIRNELGNSLAIFHEYLHAELLTEGLSAKDDAIHKKLATTEYLQRTRDFLTEMSSTEGWELTESQITDLSYFGLTSTTAFESFIDQKAGITEESWRSRKEELGEEKYNEIKKQADTAYENWYDSVIDLMNDRQYYKGDNKAQRTSRISNTLTQNSDD